MNDLTQARQRKLDHLADWRQYAQEVEPQPDPGPRLSELLAAMHSRMGATPPDAELPKVFVPGMAARWRHNGPRQPSAMRWSRSRASAW